MSETTAIPAPEAPALSRPLAGLPWSASSRGQVLDRKGEILFWGSTVYGDARSRFDQREADARLRAHQLAALANLHAQVRQALSDAIQVARLLLDPPALLTPEDVDSARTLVEGAAALLRALRGEQPEAANGPR